jgi:hypothetical protein
MARSLPCSEAVGLMRRLSYVFAAHRMCAVLLVREADERPYFNGDIARAAFVSTFTKQSWT